jgi:hypothetical protein
MSALPRIADLTRTSHHVRKVQPAHAVRQKGSLFDHLVGGGEQRWRDAETKRFGGLEVQFEGHVRRLLTGRSAGRPAPQWLTLPNLQLRL